MSEKIDDEIVDWETLYQSEHYRLPVRQLCPGIHRHFAWAYSNDEYKVPMDWLTHYAPAFHFTDEEISASRTTTDMPPAEGVYFFFDGDECIYVGQTQNFSSRIEQHKRAGMRWTSHAYFEVPKFFASDVEAYYIRRIRPRLNTSYSPTRTYSSIVEKLGLDRRLISLEGSQPT